MTAWELNPSIIKTLKNVGIFLLFGVIEYVLLLLGVIC